MDDEIRRLQGPSEQRLNGLDSHIGMFRIRCGDLPETSRFRMHLFERGGVRLVRIEPIQPVLDGLEREYAETKDDECRYCADRDSRQPGASRPAFDPITER